MMADGDLFLTREEQDVEWHKSVFREAGMGQVSRGYSSYQFEFEGRKITCHKIDNVSFFICPGCDELKVGEAFWHNNEDYSIRCLGCGVGK